MYYNLLWVTPTAKRNSYRVAAACGHLYHEPATPSPHHGHLTNHEFHSSLTQEGREPSKRLKHSEKELPPLGRALKKSPIPCK